MSCIIRGCNSHSGNKNNSKNNISFHKFPACEEIRSQWFVATGRNKKKHAPYWKVCSKHFERECFLTGNLLRARLKEDAVPTLNLNNEAEFVMGGKTLNIANGENASGTDPAPQKTKSAYEYETHIDRLQQKVYKLRLLAKRRSLKINAKKQQAIRLKNKNSKLEMQLKQLVKKQKIDQESLMALECAKKNKIIERYLFKAKGCAEKEYPMELKEFAVTLHYLSPKAYDFVRDELIDVLPHPATVIKWRKII